MTTTETAARILDQAKDYARLTWPEFDFALTSSGLVEIDMAVGTECDRQIGPVVFQASDEYMARRAQLSQELWAEVRDAIEERKTAALARGFLGWSNAARARGQRIRYAS